MNAPRTPQRRQGSGSKGLERQNIIGLGTFALLAGAFGLYAAVTEPPAERQAVVAKQHLKLAAVSPANRRDVDYAVLDARLKQLIERPGMVGLSVGVIEGGRITFLAGYGETLAGSGEKVTPQTVFRWASVSKGVAGTMVAKLAEQGKLNLFAPVAQYSASLKLPGGNENRATVADLLSHRLGLYRNAYDNKLEEGHDPAFLRSTLVQLNSICAPGQCWSYQNVAYDASSEIVATLTGQSYEAAVKEQLFDPIGMTSASITPRRAGQFPKLGAAAQRRPQAAGSARHLLQGPGGGRGQQLDQGSCLVDGRPGRRNARRAVAGSARRPIQAPLVKTPSERSRLRKFLERLSEPRIWLWLAQL